mgnify:CR=1|tara:strand:+ start:417 stop:953 length:537 start_codon:yes stop_codon:yes gene_type:complete
MSTLKVDTILKRTGTGTITLGQSGDTVTLGTGASQSGFGGTNTPNFFAKTSSQSISASTTTVVVYSSEDYDTSSLYDTSTGRFTVDANTTGKYFFYAAVKYASSSISRNNLALHKNGTETLRTEFGNSSSYPTVLVSGVINLSSAGDYVDARVNQNDGTKSLSGESEGNFFGGYKLIT